MVDKMTMAGLAYVLTEYVDLAQQFREMDTERGFHTKKAHDAQHKADRMAYQWAKVNDLPMGGPEFTQRMYVSAARYREEHADDVAEWNRTHDRRARRDR